MQLDLKLVNSDWLATVKRSKSASLARGAGGEPQHQPTNATFHPADLVFDPTLAHRGLRFGTTRPLTHNPLAREAVYLLSNGRCDLPLGRAVLAAGRTPRLTWILLTSSAMN